MKKSSRSTKPSQDKKQTVLQKFSIFFFVRARLTIVVLLLLFAGGVYVYTSSIKKEGFPPVQFPVAIISGQYFVDDANRVDREVAQPLTETVQAVEGVSEVQSVANSSFYRLVVFFEDDVSVDAGTARIQAAVEDSSVLPRQATADFQKIEPAKFLNEYDLLLSVYAKEASSPAELERVAEFVSEALSEDSSIESAFVQQLVSTATDPATGEQLDRQTAFSRIGIKSNDELAFYPAVAIGINKVDSVDVLQLSAAADRKIAELDLSEFGGSYFVVRSADFADTVSSQIESLESNLLSGLLAVSLVSFLLISWRASVITAIFMMAVMITVVLILWLVGYTLNTITLFGLVLSLGLFVDDATIVVEALDAARSRKRSRRQAALYAIRRVATASTAGTFTTVLVFLPLVFVSGILGEFIRLLPITVIIALITSLVLSLTIIPVLAKYLLLKDHQLKRVNRFNPIARAEEFLGERLARLPLLLQNKHRLGYGFAALAIAVSLLFVGGAGYFASKLSFNIFPPTKDSEQVAYSITFAPGTDIQQAQQLTDTVNKTISSTAGEEIERIAFGRSGQPNERSADALIELTAIEEREVTSRQLLEQLSEAVAAAVPQEQARVRFIQIDAGPPAEEFPFRMQVYGEDTNNTLAFTESVEGELINRTIELPNGEVTKVTDTQIANPSAISRENGRRFVELQASFDSEDTSAIVQATQTELEDLFNDEFLDDYGLQQDDITFDFGQESDNAESFSSLSIAFPVALLLMYLLLAVQFRSVAQPLLIFIAIPFSLLGVFAGLYVTNNPFSFFVQVGLIGLIGIAVNNSILLTDYANQELRSGKSKYQAIAAATKLRFRPLLATSITTVVALTPLALSDPFWEPLALTIIFGLLSSTFLVIVAFPYYFLLFESVRHKPRAKQAFAWIAGLTIGLGAIGLQGDAFVFVGLYTGLTLLLRKQWQKIGA